MTRIRRSPAGLRIALLAMGWGMILGALRAAPVQPSYRDAYAFGLKLQEEFRQRSGRALSERLNGDAFRDHVFQLFGREAVESENTKQMWAEQVYPSVVTQLQSFARFDAFLVSRVVLIDDVRTLECVLIDKENRVEYLDLMLAQGRDGTIGIQDFRLWGSKSSSRAMQENLLTMGYTPSTGGTDDDFELERVGQRCRMTIVMAMDAYAARDYKKAYSLWSSLTPEMKATRYWHDFRDRLAFVGEPTAIKGLMKDYADGKDVDPMLRYSIASYAGEPKAVLAALDVLLLERGQPANLRATKASWLILAGKPQEALALAQDTYELTPFAGQAYLVAIEAAVACKRNDAAWESVHRWSVISTPATIEGILTQTPALAEFCATPAYVAWKKEAAKSVPAKAEPPSPPAKP